jgi:hypothetical protein
LRYLLVLALMVISAAAEAVAPPPVTHDVLVLYTQKAATRWGEGLRAKVDKAIAYTNGAHTNSRTGIVVRVLAFEQTAFVESGNFFNTRSALASNTAIKARRDQLGADLVLLVSEDTGCGGAGSNWRTFSGGQTTSLEAFAVVTSSSLPPASWVCGNNLTVAHEIGHMQGLGHNREDDSAGLQAGYRFGYRICAPGGFRDLMSYPCPNVNVPIVARFSNPKAFYNGLPFGIAYEVAPYQAADSVRYLKETAPLIANFRNP